MSPSSPDDPEIPRRDLNTDDVSAIVEPAPRKSSWVRRHWGKLSLVTLIGVPLLALIAWSYAALQFTYSSGSRVGYVQKLSKKGWLCKTWEGELQISAIPGSAPVIFTFTVRDDSIAGAITAALASRVELHFEQHPGIPLSCFGETEYFVTEVKPLAGQVMPPP
jgi:hypothetical protein